MGHLTTSTWDRLPSTSLPKICLLRRFCGNPISTMPDAGYGMCYIVPMKMCCYCVGIKLLQWHSWCPCKHCLAIEVIIHIGPIKHAIGWSCCPKGIFSIPREFLPIVKYPPPREVLTSCKFPPHKILVACVFPPCKLLVACKWPPPCKLLAAWNYLIANYHILANYALHLNYLLAHEW